jgi:hypothetical protein
MTQKEPDPVATFRNLITEWERGFDSLANRLMGTEEFSRSMNQFQNMQMGMQKAFNEAMASQLSAFNLPSRDDVLRIGENLRALDQRVARVEELLINIASGGKTGAKKARKSKKGPPRTRKAPSHAEGNTNE